jgi:lysophospholipase L1-like esterase
MRFACVLLLLSISSLSAQNPEPPPASDQQQQDLLEAYRRVLMDWGGLTRYGSEDAELNLKPGRARVVFLGDEIFEEWGAGKKPFFPGKPYVNRGITRQTSAQMLVRFRQDVIALHPEVVIIEAGGNDIAGVMGPASEATIADYIQSIVELAQVHKIRVVLASVLPVCDCFEKQTTRRSPVRILGLNRWMKSYAKEIGATYLDFYSALAEGRNMKRELTVDGHLPNDAGYEVMEPLAEQAIAAAMH